MKNILVTGSNGQLGTCFRKASTAYPKVNFFFKSSRQADITDIQELKKLFSQKKFDWVINCAAYTNVESAEKEKDKAFRINAEGARNMAEMCKEFGGTLIHFSTDYVFNGKSKAPYTELDIPDPINVYGESKLKGEQYITEVLKEHFILRTSWLYSEYGHNFFKTILKKIDEGAELYITSSQTGTPTNANDLTEFVLGLITGENKDFGLYHYSNFGEATWYDFAKAIIENTGKSEEIRLHESNGFKTIAARPPYSVLDKAKLQQRFRKEIPQWNKSLKRLILPQGS